MKCYKNLTFFYILILQIENFYCIFFRVCYIYREEQIAQYCVALVRTPSRYNGEISATCPTIMLGFLFIYILIIIIMFREEITLDDVIEFIIRNCDDREAMDKISRTSFPFTTKYLENQTVKPTKRPYYDKTRKPDQFGTYTLCSNEEQE